MRFALISFLILTSLSVFAQDEDCADGTPKALKPMFAVAKAVEDPNGCPNAKKIKNICMAIDSRTEDPEPVGKYNFLYQRKLLDAACVNIGKDNEAEIAIKMKKAWMQLEDKLICNSLQFDVPNGNIIKYAIATKFDDFISDISKWKVNLNKVDETDQRTVLDYIKYHIEKNKGNALEGRLKSYYKTLRDAGAKHKSEL